MTETKAGRALADDCEKTLTMYEAPSWAMLIAFAERAVNATPAIEREAAAQERERIRAALKAHGEAEPWPPEYLYALEAMDAILAEPSE